MSLEIKFKHSEWINSVNSESILTELMINSVYGITIENLRKRVNARLVNNETDFLKYTSRTTHITHKIFGKNYAAIHEIKPVLKLQKFMLDLPF